MRGSYSILNTVSLVVIPCLLVLVFLQLSCAYTMGYKERRIPGNHASVAIPVFENKTSEVGLELYFTNALIEQFNQSKVAKVLPKHEASVVIEGSIISVIFLPSALATPKELAHLPANTVLTTEYRAFVVVHLNLRRRFDQKVIWESDFRSEQVYSAPRIGLEVINSANALYNHTARHDSVTWMATETMREAHDRMTESF